MIELKEFIVVLSRYTAAGAQQLKLLFHAVTACACPMVEPLRN